MVAALAAITQRVQDRRVAAVLVKRVDPYAGVLTDEEAVAPTGRDGWWTVGPLPPKQQWAAFVGKLHAADHWLVWLVMALVAGSACAVGIAGAGVTWLSQHLGATAIGGVALALWWAAATTGGAP